MVNRRLLADGHSSDSLAGALRRSAETGEGRQGFVFGTRDSPAVRSVAWRRLGMRVRDRIWAFNLVNDEGNPALSLCSSPLLPWATSLCFMRVVYVGELRGSLCLFHSQATSEQT